MKFGNYVGMSMLWIQYKLKKANLSRTPGYSSSMELEKQILISVINRLREVQAWFELACNGIEAVQTWIRTASINYIRKHHTM